MCGCNKNKPKSTVVLPAIRSFAAASRSVVAPVVESLPIVDTSIWGPPLWNVLHIAAAATITKGRQSQWKLILNTLLTGLPCPDCTAHYVAWYRAHPIGITLFPKRNSRQIVTWFLDLHNDVNRRTGRPVWNSAQLDAAYIGNQIQIQDAKDTLATLQGVIGQNAWTALHTLLNSL